MKKLILVVAIAMTGLTSCKKEDIRPKVENAYVAKGVATLVNGQAVVNCPLVTDNSIILLTHQNNIGYPGSVHINARTAGSNFHIESTEYGDQSTIGWVMYN